ncbi:MAG: DUF305 domain-containing protein [Hyphomicrobiaceae bacterium]
MQNTTLGSRTLLITGFAAAAVAAGVWSSAASQHAGHHGHAGHSISSDADSAPSTKKFREANDAMHSEMNIAFTGNADIDFVKGMIPHHEGAVRMAEIVLEHGGDEEVRKLAQEIIDAQNKEIAWMRDWLAKRGQ